MPQTRAAFEALAERLGEAAQPVDLPDDLPRPGTIIAPSWRPTWRTISATWSSAGAMRRARRCVISWPRAARCPRCAISRRATRRGATRPALREVFNDYDAILTPAAPGVAPKGEATGNPAFCTLWTLTGLPALSLPLLTGEGGMPLGVQLVGARGDDARLLRTANWLIDDLAEDEG